MGDECKPDGADVKSAAENVSGPAIEAFAAALIALGWTLETWTQQARDGWMMPRGVTLARATHTRQVIQLSGPWIPIEDQP